MNWKREDYGWHITVSECSATIGLLHDRNLRRDSITALVTTPLFPRLDQNEFRTIADAKAWCEQWMGFAIELLELRKTVANLREQAQADFAEKMALRNELHDFRYPHAERET